MALRTAQIKNIVFDMGNVLMHFDGPHFAAQFTDCEADAHALHRALFGSTTWALLDSGTVGYDTALRVAKAHLEKRLWPNLDACFAGWAAYSSPIDQTNALAAELKREGYGIYLLSNAGTRIHEQLDHMPAWGLMDGAVVSGCERMMKPDPAIYQLLCERYDLEPGECLFVDDNADNCEGARVAGMRAVQYTGDVAAILAALED
ncbi:HAD family phosphatase [Paratractidigestivibacter sp.]|uniref:HAD family hydrolase n=1 Tax=Paratractidigestivibacter sp. TaxID=2847316 RepID=UPI002AC966A2|nr:HAD family phosphatase [Paratractidigestivibacter sp.]